jgi:hypothetical protein
MEAIMDKKPLQPTGAKRLVNKFKNNFRIPENINHYSKEDYQQAEKKYLKFCLTTGMCEDRLETRAGDGDKSRI